MAKYNPPPGSYPPQHPQHTVIVQQPVVYQPQTQVRHQSSDILGGIGRAFDSAASDLVKGAKEVTKDVANVVVSSLDFVRPGYVIQIVSKVHGKSLRVIENGRVDCGGESGTSCQFEVLSAGPGTSTVKLRNMAQPQFYLSISGGYLIGYGQGGPDCDFIPAATIDHYVTFESAQIPGSHIGVLPSGQITAPGQTTKATDASHFRIVFIRTTH